MRDTTFEEVWFMRLSRLNVIAVLSTAIIVMTAVIIAFIVYTPLKEMIPGYPTAETTRDIRLNALRLDSLEHQLYLKDQYIENILTIMSGGIPESFESTDPAVQVNPQNIQDYRSKEDSMLRLEVEEQQRYNLSLFEANPEIRSLSDLFFFSPVQGMINGRFNPELKHYGVDVVVSGDPVVKSVLDGTVLLANYTAETGYLIQIQHENELISVYRHNKELLKKPGDLIRAGEAIAIVGNTGEITTGPHLHFELWHKGKPIDPIQFISFE